MTVFESNGIDYPTAAEAIAAVEAAGKEARVVEFHLTKNNPGCLPEYRYNSCAMWIYKENKWYRFSIHGGTAENMGEEKPH